MFISWWAISVLLSTVILNYLRDIMNMIYNELRVLIKGCNMILIYCICIFSYLRVILNRMDYFPELAISHTLPVDVSWQRFLWRWYILDHSEKVEREPDNYTFGNLFHPHERGEYGLSITESGGYLQKLAMCWWCILTLLLCQLNISNLTHHPTPTERSFGPCQTTWNP